MATTDKDKPGFLDSIKSFGSALAAAPGAIARDVNMGFSANPFAGRDKQRENLQAAGYKSAQIDDYFARTDATKARMDAEAAARGDRDDGGIRQPVAEPTPEELGPRLNNPAFQYRQSLANRYMNQPPPAGGLLNAGPDVTQNMMGSALNIFESQRGAGQMPYQMMPYGLASLQPQMQPGQYVSPAFQYAAQNYGRLGGMQRLMPRPIPMLSAAERQTVNDMARAMAEQQEYDTGRRMMGKGGGGVGRQFSDAVAPGMAGRSFGIASLRGLPSYLMR